LPFRRAPIDVNSFFQVTTAVQMPSAHSAVDEESLELLELDPQPVPNPARTAPIVTMRRTRVADTLVMASRNRDPCQEACTTAPGEADLQVASLFRRPKSADPCRFAL